MTDIAVLALATASDSGCLSPKMLNNIHIMQRKSTPRRFTKTNLCPICGGHHALAQGQGVRCFGYYDSSGSYARCTREEKAGSLPQNRDGTYSHRLNGDCRCGHAHGEAPAARLVATTNSGRRGAQQTFRSYFTLAAFLKKRHGEGTTVSPWIYRDATGCEVFRVLRIDYNAPDGTRAKSYRPCHKGDDARWHLSRPTRPLPLYNLQSVVSAPPQAVITVLEGEKCTEIATAIGLPHATTSAHGAKAPQLTDWSPLAGRLVAILRDEGERGAEYAVAITAILAKLDPSADVRVIRLPGLSDGEDIEQWAATRRSSGLTDAEILTELVALIEAAVPVR
jgi:hypothetical protein